MDLPDMPGTIAIADRLDVLKLHGWIRRKDEKARQDLLVPLPYFGDLLLFLTDDRGPYCINWTIKQDEKDFQRSVNLRSRVRNQQKDTRAAQARHAIEEQLYWDAGIRTVRFVAVTVPEKLDHNLRNLYLHHRSSNALDEAVERELADRLRASLTTGEPPQSILLAVTHRHGHDYQDVRQAFFRLLWERRIRVELIDEVVLVDRPLKPERNDVLQRFTHLFGREVYEK
ncbi:hypothetical protein [Massilia aquatica]|uniref:Uncharacterized protein n=1 Tax=Massilia aquatica TaxID=2609000 RepID=A0ABX0MD20_9BURK|nr:hypothetical protein [Massilia aquatica]NHZ45043.1 hypothetical protein [Massilia aquatica]